MFQMPLKNKSKDKFVNAVLYGQTSKDDNNNKNNNNKNKNNNNRLIPKIQVHPYHTKPHDLLAQTQSIIVHTQRYQRQEGKKPESVLFLSPQKEKTWIKKAS